MVARSSSVAGLVVRDPLSMSKTLGEQADQRGGTGSAGAGGRNVQRVHTVAEDQLAVLHGGIEVAARLVEVGDDDGPGHADWRIPARAPV